MTTRDEKSASEMTRRSRHVSLWPALLLIATLTGTSSIFAATITVHTNDPAINADGDCSLIEAVINANADFQIHTDCKGGAAGPDTIELSMGGTYSLESEYGFDNGLPQINSEITINGHDSILERSPGAVDLFRVLEVTLGGVLTINNLTIQNGEPDGPEPWGGGLRNNGGNMTLNRCTIRNNASEYGGGVCADNFPVTSLVGTTVSGNTSDLDGGGIWAEGELTLVRSEVSGNTARTFSGGGIATGDTSGNFSDVFLFESTVSENTAGNAGGGVFVCVGIFQMIRTTVSDNTAGAAVSGFPVGGGVALCSVDATIDNSTISGNQVVGTSGQHFGEGGALAIGSFGSADTIVTISDSTIANNTAPEGGEAISIWETGGGFISEARLSNSIFENTSSDPTSLCKTDGSSILVSNDHNLASDFSCGLAESNDVENTSAMLTPLGDNAGPTRTHLPMGGSPAINTGRLTTLDEPDTDQRGFPRPHGPQCDRGSVEWGHIFWDSFESGDASAWGNATQ